MNKKDIEDNPNLAEINDSAGISFRKISTIIKKRADSIFNPEVAILINKHFKNETKNS